MKFHEISGNFMKFPPENEKMDLALDRLPFLVVIFTSKIENFHDFHEKSEISMNFMKFHHFHEKTHFLPQSALWAPKTINICCAMEGFPPRAGKVRFFRKKSHFLLIFTLFAKIIHFHDFQDSWDFHGKTLIWRYTGGRKSCVDTFRVVSFCPKAQNDENEHFSAKIMIFSEICEKG